MGAPILVQNDYKAETVFAAFAANKGKGDDAAKHGCMNREWLGHKRATMRIGQENAMEERFREVKKTWRRLKWCLKSRQLESRKSTGWYNGRCRIYKDRQE